MFAKPNFFNKSFLSEVVVFAMFFGLAVDMSGELQIRNISLLVCVTLLIFMHGVALPKNWMIPFSLFILYPIVLLLIGVLQDVEMPLAISQYQSTIFAFIIFVLVSRMPYKLSAQALIYSIFFVALFSVILAAGLWLGIGPLSAIVSFMADAGGGYFGERSVGIESVLPNVYFKVTLFYIPIFLISLFQRRYLISTICFFGLVAAVSKTGIVFTLISAILFFAVKGNLKSRVVVIFLIVLAVIFIINSPIFFLFDEIAKNESSTVDVRGGHLRSIVELWLSHPANFVFGFGLGSKFYSSGVNQVVSNIEIDHLNVVRKYGFLWAALFFSWVLSVAYKAIRSDLPEVRGLGWSLLLAFIVAGTNPVLVSPVFFLFLSVTMAANFQTRKNLVRK